MDDEAPTVPENEQGPVNLEEETVRDADLIAEWVSDVLQDGISKDPKELEVMAWDGLQKACKDHDYHSEVLFASLVDFYQWIG